MKLIDVGSRIKSLRKKKGLTQTELAVLCGFDRTYLSRIEKGKQNLTLETLFLICEKLSISIKDFFDFNLA